MRPRRTQARPSAFDLPRVMLIAVISVILLVTAGLLLRSPVSSATTVEVTAVPLEITQTERRGHVICTNDWVIVTDMRATYASGSRTDALSDNALKESATLAAICRVAKQRQEQVTFIGIQATDGGTPRSMDGKPVLLVRTIRFGGEEIILHAD